MGTSATKRLVRKFRDAVALPESERKIRAQRTNVFDRGVEEDDSGGYLTLPARDSIEPPQPVYRPKSAD